VATGGSGCGGVAGEAFGAGAGSGAGAFGGLPQAAKTHRQSNRQSVLFKQSPQRVLEQQYTLLCAVSKPFIACGTIFCCFSLGGALY
jgi:hypothetical protein